MLRKMYEYIKDEEFRYTIYNDRIHIVNYDDISSLSSEDVLIRYRNKRIKVKGRGLILNRLLEREALIIGEVINIEVIYE
ncbi:MAG: YabP/YqfC family sporulation protein [Mycoplasmatota bacterium]|nr:YabP/YqfC family sporulation protein [Mycoplasmatota bacterium]